MIKIGIMGAGGVSRAHLPGYIENSSRAKVVAVSDLLEKAARDLASKLGPDVRTYGDFNELLEKEELDAVDICLPHNLHASAIIAAAQKVKTIMVEKPLCISMEEADAIRSAVKDKGVNLIAAHTSIFTPSVQDAKRLSQGLVGRTYEIITNESFVLEDLRGSWRTKKAEMGGGELIDTGYHPLYRILYLSSSDPVEVYAATQRFRLDMEGEDSALLTIKFADGSLGQVNTSWAYENPYGYHSFYIIGEKGQLYGEGNFLGYKIKGFAEATRKYDWKDPFIVEVGHMIDVAEGKAQPLQGIDDAYKVMKLATAAYRSVEAGTPVKV